MSVEVFNLDSGDWEGGRDRPGYTGRYTRVGDRIGASMIGGSVYELPHGERTFPYHFHYGIEEWLIVLDGEPMVRTPSGERTLRRGDALCFPDGPEGAHTITGPARILLLSANRVPSISAYPDSGKLGARPGVEADTLNFRRADAVDYWEGE